MAWPINFLIILMKWIFFPFLMLWNSMKSPFSFQPFFTLFVLPTRIISWIMKLILIDLSCRNMSIIHFYNIDLILALLLIILLTAAAQTFVIWKIAKRILHKVLWRSQNRRQNVQWKSFSNHCLLKWIFQSISFCCPNVRI